MPERLPKGWVKTTLGEIASPSREHALPTEVPDMRYVGLEHIEPQTMRLLGMGSVHNIRSSSLRFSKGDVLYGKMRPYLNKVWVAEFDGLCSPEFLVFAKCDGLNSQFLGLRLNSDDFVNFANEQISGERPRVDFEKLAPFPIALPPLAEQERIIGKLNSALPRVKRAEMAARRAQEGLQHHRTAVLHDAVTGELTRRWRVVQRKNKTSNTETGKVLLQRLLVTRRTRWEKTELRRLKETGKKPNDNKWKSRYPEPTSPRIEGLSKLPFTWTWGTLDQLTSFVTSGSRGWKSYYSANGPLFIRSQDIRADRLDLSEVAHVRPPKNSEGSRTEVKRWDLLLTITADIGKVAVVEKEPGEAYVSQHVGLIRFIDARTARLAQIYITSPEDGRKLLLASAHGAGKSGLNLENVRGLPIPIPPLTEQTEIIRKVQASLSAADRLSATLNKQFRAALQVRRSLLREAFTGRLARQDPKDEPASLLLEQIRVERIQFQQVLKETRQRRKRIKGGKGVAMKQLAPSAEALRTAWQRIGKKTNARRLFDAAGFEPEHVVRFYEILRATPEVRKAFEAAGQGRERLQHPIKRGKGKQKHDNGHFRLIELWLEDFKNLRDYEVFFNPAQGLDVVLGWNGTGKSNLFEALVIIFRDLTEWSEKNRWPDKPMKGFRLSYEVNQRTVEITWQPGKMKRPELRMAATAPKTRRGVEFEPIKREQLPLPRFVFGYYSGPTNRLAEHFLPMKQAHYARLRNAKADDAKTLAELLQQRRFFCAETHHAKYVLLAFSYKEDPKITLFLKDRLRILGFESALFVIRKPNWAKRGSKAEGFWGATGVMRKVMERLSRHAIAPIVLQQKVSYGYKSTTEDHYYFFLPDLKSLHSFAAEYQDAQTFFLALESIDFSELIHDVKIQVRVKASDTEQVSITFHQLSEGEQQLLMVLGLMRFTKSDQSLVLLDEPDTHLNPHWSIDYLKDLTRVMSDNAIDSTEQQTSQILMATHDPLVIASLIKEQVHLLKRDPNTGACKWFPANVNPRGLGFTGILTSEMFGFRSDLDPETLADLDSRVRLVGKEGSLSPQEAKQLEQIDKRLAGAGFSKAFSDPYYAAFVRAWGRRHSELMAGQQFLSAEKQQEVDRIAHDVLKETMSELEQETQP